MSHCDPRPAGARACHSVADGYFSWLVPLDFLFLASSGGGPIVLAVAFSILLEPPGFSFQLFPQGRIRGGFKCELWSCSLVLSPFLQLVSQVYCISVADQYLLCHQRQVSEPRPHLNPAWPSCTANTSSLSFLSSATPVQWRCEISCNESIPSTTHSLIPSLSCFKAVPCVCVSAEVNIWCPVGYATSRAERPIWCVWQWAERSTGLEKVGLHL